MDSEVHPERMEKAAEDLDEAVHSAAQSRRHLDRAVDRLATLVMLWRYPVPSRRRIRETNPSD